MVRLRHPRKQVLAAVCWSAFLSTSITDLIMDRSRRLPYKRASPVHDHTKSSDGERLGHPQQEVDRWSSAGRPPRHWAIELGLGGPNMC